MDRSGIIEQLSESLVLRWAAPSDAEALIAFHEAVQGEGEWTRALVEGAHPTTSVENFTLVEDVQQNKIASSMCYIPQTWTYGGIEFSASRLEMVSTGPEYRWGGLVRKQFEHIHRVTAEAGHLLQLVVGRPWVYRKLGYHMALRYWNPHEFSLHGLPGLEEGEQEPYTARPAAPDDIPFITRLYQSSHSHYLMTCVWDESLWRHQLFERAENKRLQVLVLENQAGDPAGYILHGPELYEGLLSVYQCEMQPGQSWLVAFPSFMRHLKAAGTALAVQQNSPLEGFYIGMAPDHPFYQLSSDYLQRSLPEAPFAWYVRLPDPAAFIRRIAPVLEQRLASSLAAGHTGVLKLSFYEKDGGLVLTFEQGRLVYAENREVERNETQAALPYEMFLPLLLGYKSVEEIEGASPEVWLRSTERVLMKILFPKELSKVFAVA